MLSRAEKLNIAMSSDQETVAFQGKIPDAAETPKVCILARVSSSKQEKEGTIDAQLKQCHELFAQYFPSNPEYLVHISTNEGLNLETKDKRFDFWKVLEKVKNGEVTHIICISLDRCFRGANKVLNAEISQVFTNHRVNLITSDGVKKYNPTDITGQLLDSVQESLGPIEKKNLVRKLQKARRHHLTENRQWKMAVVPFGYAVKTIGSGRTKQFVYSIIEDEAEIVRDIFRIYSKQKTMVIPSCSQDFPGVKVIAAHLNRLGISKESWLDRIPTGHQAKNNSSKWNGVFINRILTNPIYRGDLIVCFNRPADNAAYEADSIAQKISVPPIVPLDLWESVRKVRARKSKIVQDSFAKSAQQLNWLHRLILCPTCHKPLGGYTSSKGERYYMCRHKRADKREHPTFRAIDIEKNLGKLILERIKKDILWESMHGIIGSVKADNKFDQAKHEREMLVTRQTELDKQLSRLTEYLLKGTIPEVQYLEQKKRINQEQSDVKSRLHEVDTLLKRQDMQSQSLQGDIERLKTKFHHLISSGSAETLLILRDAAACLVSSVSIEFLLIPDINSMNMNELKELFKQGRILPKQLNAAGWSDRKIKKHLGLSGRRNSLNYQVKVIWKTGRTETVYPWD